MPNLDAIAANHYLISAGHYLASAAGLEVLANGGNAIDAGVASSIALGVLQSDQVNFAGVAPIMIYLAERDEVLTIAGLGSWPMAADIEHFVNEFNGGIPLGVLRTVIPAAPDAHITALSQFGTMSFGEVAGAAIRYAAEGFPMHGLMADYIAGNESTYRLWPDNESIYLPKGRPPRPGERFVQSDLAGTIRYMVDQESSASGRGREAGLAAARDAFYRGDIAATILRYHREHGGWLQADDLANYHSPIVAPARRRFSGFGGTMEVFTCGAWSQGPAMLQMLGLAEGFDVQTIGHNSTEYLHVLAESFKLAFADRERYFGDPEVVDVPLDELLSDPYLVERRALIDPQRAAPGLPPAGLAGGNLRPPRTPMADPRAQLQLPGDTSFTCVVDAKGNVFAANPSDVTWESPVIPGTGICPSSRGSQSWAVPGHASSVAPGKRPRLTPNPIMFRRNGGPVMPIGTPGGDVQPQAVMQVLLNLHCFGMNPQAAIDAPRIVTHSQPNSFAPHEAYPGRLDIESGAGSAAAEGLERLGHKVEVIDGPSYRAAGVCVIERDSETNALWGGADRRRPSQALGW